MNPIIFYIQTSATTAATTIAVCPVCGAMKRSQKLSCCARGGSWYGKCGSAGDENGEHTWHEGIQACKARQSQVVMAQQQHAVRRGGTNAYSDAGTVVSSEPEALTDHMHVSTVASTALSDTTSTTVANTSLRTTTRVSIGAPVLLNDPGYTSDRTSIAYDAGAITSKATNIGATSTTTPTSVSTSAPESDSRPTKPWETTSGLITPSGNTTHAKRGRVSMREVVSDVVSLHKSGSGSIKVRECDSTLNSIVCLGMLICIIFC